MTDYYFKFPSNFQEILIDQEHLLLLFFIFVHEGQSHDLIWHMKHEECSWLKWQAQTKHAEEEKKTSVVKNLVLDS